MTERNIAIGIDSTKAVSGGRVVKRALDDVGNAASNTEKKVDKARDSLGRFVGAGNAANNNLRQISASAAGANSALQRLAALFVISRNAAAGLVASLSGLRALFIALAAGTILTQFIHMADAFSKMNSQLRLVTTSTRNLVEVNEELYRSSQRTRSSYEASVTLFAKLSRATQGLGLSQRNMVQIVENINKSFIISGASAEEAAYSIHQLAQGLASGTLRGDEFNSVAEQAPKLLEIVAKYLKMNVGQLREYASQGKITADVITKALLGATDDLQKDFVKVAATVDGAMVVLRNSVLRSIGVLDQAFGISSGIAQGIIAISKGIDALTDGIVKMAPYAALIGTGLAVAFGPTIVASVVSLIALISGGLVQAIGAATTAMIAFSLSNPFTALLLAITTAVTAVYYFRDEIQKAIGVDVVQVIKDTVNIIIGSFVAAYEDIKWLWNTFPTLMTSIMIEVVNVINSKLNDIIKGFTNTLDEIINLWNKLLVAMGSTPVKTFAEEGVFQIPHIFNDALIELELALKQREKLIKDALGKDYLGDLMKLFTPSVPATPPGSTLDTPGTKVDQPQPEYDKIIKSAEDRIRTLQTEAEALKLTGYAASVYTEQQNLINKALSEGVTLSDAMREKLMALGEQMAALKSQAAGLSMLQDQQSEIGRLQLERTLITATTAEREKALAVYDAEQQMIQKGIDLQSQHAAAIRANAAASAQLKLENERITAAYTTLTDTAASAIDTMVAGATTVGNSWKDTFKNILTSFTQMFTQLAVANPLKNALLGTNLPTFSDLFAGKSTATFTPPTTTTGTMTVTAGTVMVNGGMMPGIPGATTGTFPSSLGAVLGIPNTPVNGVRPTLTPGGVVNSPVSQSALQNPAIAGLLNDPSLAARVASPSTNTELYRQAISKIESGSFAGNYNALGPVTRSGDQAYGRYQVMGNNVPSWTQQHYGQRLTPSEFLANKQAQDAVFDGEFGSYVSKYGEGPAATKWFTGSHIAKGRSDGYTVDTDYQKQFEGNLSTLRSNQTSSIPGAEEASQSLSKLSTSSLKASTDVTSLSTGADTAAKALSTSSSSVASSTTTLATTTAQIPQQTQGLFSSMMSSIGGGFSSMFSGLGSLFGGLFAEGGVFKNGAVTAFATGGIVTSPTMFPMKNGLGLMGERGAEAIMPLRRGPDGNLGVGMHGGTAIGPDHTSSQVIKMETTIKVEGVGDKDLMKKIHDGVEEQQKQGFKRFSREELPGHVKKIQNDKWARG